MKYDIIKPVRPKMPKPGKGLEVLKLLQSQVSKSMYEPLAPMVFPSLGAHISSAEFKYLDRSWKDYSSAEAEYCSIRVG